MGAHPPPASADSVGAGRARDEQRRIRVWEYHRMIEAGILSEDEHVELLDGLLIVMTPQNPPHARAIQRLNQAFTRALPDEFAVLPQLPLTLSDDSEPGPDLAVVRAEDARSTEHHPHTALLVVEVAADSLARDRGAKAALYARAGIPEYWVVNLTERAIEVFRNPDTATGRYSSAFVVSAGESVSPAFLPSLELNAEQILGT
jgi:Uma2 family endonuclease